MKEALTRELTISSNLNRLNQRSIFMPEPAAAAPVFTKGDIREGALRLATKETRTKTGEENRPGAVLARSIEEKRDLNDPESALRELAGQESFGGGNVAEVDTKKGREFVEKSFTGKYDETADKVVRSHEEQRLHKKVVEEKGRLESVIKDYASLSNAQKAPIRDQVAHMLRQKPEGEALLNSLPPTAVVPYLDSLITQSSEELVQIYDEIYGAEPIANNIDAAQARVDKLKNDLENKRKELEGLKEKTGLAETSAIGVSEEEGSEKMRIPTTKQELTSLEQDLVSANEDIQLWSGKLIPGKEDTGGFKEKLEKALTKRDALREALREGRKGLENEQQTGETETTEEKIARLEREIFTLPSEIGQAQADLDLAKLSRREDLEVLEENSKNAIPEAVARHLNIAIEQAEQEIKAEIKVMKEKATTEKEKEAIETIEKAIDSRYSTKRAVTGRNGRVKKVKEVFDRPNMWLDARILVEDGEDAYMAALVKGVDPKTLTVEERNALKSSAKETLSALKQEDLARLKTMAKEKLINSFTRADGKLPSGMESYLLDTPDGQKMIDEAAAKHKEAFKGVKGKVSEYFRTMNRKKALKLLLFLFMPLVISAPLMAAGKFHPFSE